MLQLLKCPGYTIVVTVVPPTGVTMIKNNGTSGQKRYLMPFKVYTIDMKIINKKVKPMNLRSRLLS